MELTLALLGPTKLVARARAAIGDGIVMVDGDLAMLRAIVAPRPPARAPRAPWILVTPEAALDVEIAIAAVLAGAMDACTIAELPAVARRRLAELAVPHEAAVAPEDYVARSAAARRVLAELERVAPTNMAVLITGETGTGKEVIASHLHRRSQRRGELVPINCAAIPNELIEGELFGFVKGAFSGAVADYEGLLRGAAGGTVFLDEVDDTPKTLQVKLLRVLEDHVVARLGENSWRQVDFRVIAATNRDLGELVRRGEFGGDLYQRLAIVKLSLPPLRDRREDLPELVGRLVERFYRDEPRAPHRVAHVTAPAMTAMLRYAWPGNVRELRNVLFQALVNKRSGDELLLADLPTHVIANRAATPDDAAAAAAGPVDAAAIARAVEGGTFNLRAARDDLEKAALTAALARGGGSPARAARLLGEVGRGESRDPAGTVRAMMRRHGL